MSHEIKNKMSNSWKVAVVLSVLPNFSHTSNQNTASVPGGESQAAPAVYWRWLCDMILSKKNSLTMSQSLSIIVLL